jgi:hypothetical protein
MPFRKRSSPAPGTLRRAVPAALCSVGLAGLAGGLIAVPAASAHTSALAASPHTGGVVSSVARVPSEKAVLAYWTPARLRAAKPADVIVAGRAPDVRRPTAKQSGRPGLVTGGLPGGQGRAAAHPTARITPESFPYPYPYDSFTPPPSLWPTWPYEVNGTLFFTNNNNSYSCSATSVASASGASNENEIWTAGHCLVNTESNIPANQMVDSWALFIPAYNGNVSNFDPYGEFVWNGGWITTSAWYNNKDFTEDEAAMTVRPSNTTGQTLGQAVGWDGFAWNYPVNEKFVAFGYPAAPPYNGLNMVEDIAATAGQDSRSGADSIEPVVIGNPMTPGSSGGAWDIFWSDSGPGYIDGHNDYNYTSQPLSMYSPYQDTLSNTVRCFGQRSC